MEIVFKTRAGPIDFQSCWGFFQACFQNFISIRDQYETVPSTQELVEETSSLLMNGLLFSTSVIDFANLCLLPNLGTVVCPALFQCYSLSSFFPNVMLGPLPALFPSRHYPGKALDINFHFSVRMRVLGTLIFVSE